MGGQTGTVRRTDRRVILTDDRIVFERHFGERQFLDEETHCTWNRGGETQERLNGLTTHGLPVYQTLYFIND